MENIRDLKIGDDILVCGRLKTKITKIEDDKIYSLNEEGIEQWETIDAIELIQLIENNMEEKSNKKFMGNKSFKIDCGIYPFEIFVFFSDLDYMFDIISKYVSDESFSKFKEIFNDSSHDGRFIINKENTMIIHLFEEPNDIESLNVLNHEILHATIGLHRIIDSDLCYQSEESYTYLFQYLCNQIYKQLSMFKNV